jgi:hypothetical protein
MHMIILLRGPDFERRGITSNSRKVTWFILVISEAEFIKGIIQVLTSRVTMFSSPPIAPPRQIAAPSSQPL